MQCALCRRPAVPTDPAVVFSVLGQREVAGRGDIILKGESGANDPVGIALMASLIGAGGLSAGAFGRVGGEFVLQMGVGAAAGVAGGAVLLWFMRRVPLPGEPPEALGDLLGPVPGADDHADERRARHDPRPAAQERPRLRRRQTPRKTTPRPIATQRKMRSRCRPWRSRACVHRRCAPST